TRQTQFAVRGIGLTDYAANNTGTVGVYIDEVNHPYAVTFQGSLFDIDHVEVLRGPQGTLFGRNTTAGVVSIKTNDPTDTLKAGLDAQY
ncbi:TonB-dependent receptor plug domain-containing protein, partial [Paenibacillus polymyxa]|nr:TonB-dependent receptor plug domain-containing protein [Paenibacillus polymyxa]